MDLRAARRDMKQQAVERAHLVLIGRKGVNQRRRYASPSFTANAVSEKLFSFAMFIIRSIGSHCSMTQTAA